ncbi:MAG: aminomethyltransferase beta-barrel domain-containing protein, partial [Hyphomicrobiales bacterium]|nr:aminomethyltransferase beta-barrel domain-containing protein [Hyphomicrobiales bacterium]
AIEDALREGRLEVHVKVRSTRPPQSAWLSTGPDGYEVELVDGEEGVAPGQACVFYDVPSGRARVLGGGFIQSASPVLSAGERSGVSLLDARASA